MGADWMKGQYFLLATVFIVIAVILLKGMFGFFDITKERSFHEGTFLEKNLKNIEKEYEYLIGIASLQNDPKSMGIEYMWNFTNFVRRESESKILYIFAFNNITSGKYYVTIGNFLNDRIYATINVTDSTTLGSSLGIMVDKQNTTTEFTPSISGQINITLTYNTKNDVIVEKLPISSASNSIYGFFDIKLESRNFIIRTKETYNRTL
jgi:hypothetical protein